VRFGPPSPSDRGSGLGPRDLAQHRAAAQGPPLRCPIAAKERGLRSWWRFPRPPDRGRGLPQ
jgi:hypothetical protein